MNAWARRGRAVSLPPRTRAARSPAQSPDVTKTEARVRTTTTWPARAGVRVLLALLAALIGAATARVGEAQAQERPAGKVYRIGFLSQGQPPKAYMEALRLGLRERGYVEGRNLVWEMRSTDGSLDQLSQFADDLVRLKVDVILDPGSPGATAAKKATSSIPIVFFAVYAPVEVGLVPSLGRPGGNITGTAVNASDMAGKRVQLLKELVPTLKRVAMLSHPPHPTTAVQLRGVPAPASDVGPLLPPPPHPTNAVQLRGTEAAARAIGVQLEVVPGRTGADL